MKKDSHIKNVSGGCGISPFGSVKGQAHEMSLKDAAHILAAITVTQNKQISEHRLDLPCNLLIVEKAHLFGNCCTAPTHVPGTLCLYFGNVMSLHDWNGNFFPPIQAILASTVWNTVRLCGCHELLFIVACDKLSNKQHNTFLSHAGCSGCVLNLIGVYRSVLVKFVFQTTR